MMMMMMMMMNLGEGSRPNGNLGGWGTPPLVTRVNP